MMYSSTPSYKVKRQLNKHASTVLLGGIFLFFSLSFFMAMCKTPCETASAEHHLLKNYKYHEGHEPRTRDYGINSYGSKTSNKKTKQGTFLILLILSGPSNFERRDVIRKTWLSVKYPNVTSYFAVATSGIELEQANKLQTENSKYSDLLLLRNMRDSYDQLTKKLLECLKSLNENYEFQYLLKVDDDSFVRTDKILHELKSKPTNRLYWGFFDGRANVKKNGQWAEKNWILCDKYGPHARGGGYVLSKDLVSYIVLNTDMLQTFRSEDISVGAWLGPLNIHREHDYRFDTEYISRGCNNQYIITHKQSPENMLEKWDNLRDTGVLCTKEVQLRLSYVYNWKVHPSQCCIRNNTMIP